MRNKIIKSCTIGGKKYTTKLNRTEEYNYTLEDNILTINVPTSNLCEIFSYVNKTILDLFHIESLSTKEWVKWWVSLWNSCTFYRFEELTQFEPFDSFKYSKETNTITPVKLTIKDLV